MHADEMLRQLRHAVIIIADDGGAAAGLVKIRHHHMRDIPEALQELLLVIVLQEDAQRSVGDDQGINPGTAGFCNALDDWLPLADVWLHGHVHCAHDYQVGDCRVVCNPLGYASKGEQVAFEPVKLIEV